MIDLKFNYKLPRGTQVTEEFETIMDFIDAVENDDFSYERLKNLPADAIFFENPRNTKSFQTIKDLYEHCVNITK